MTAPEIELLTRIAATLETIEVALKMLLAGTFFSVAYRIAGIYNFFQGEGK